MKKNLFLAAGLFMSLAAFIGCSEEESIVTTSEDFSVKASLHIESRTSLGEDNSTITWSKEDKIYLFGGKSEATLRLVTGEGTGYGEFKGSVNGSSSELNMGLYPVPDTDGNEYSYEFPTERTYSENSGAPMIGDYANNYIQFQNLTALVRIPLSNLNGDKENVVTITMTGQSIAGKAIVNVPEKTISFEGTGNEVTVKIPAGVTECNVDFPIPAGTYTGYSISLNGETVASKESEVNASASDVLVLVGDYINQKDYYEVYTAKGLLKWAYDVNEKDALELGLKIMADIEMPARTITADHENETYVFTDEEITEDGEGVPTGSNWIPVRSGISNLSEAYSGHIEGNNSKITGLRVIADNNQVGFVGAMYDDASIRNLVIDDAFIKGKEETGAAVGRSHNGTTVSNVHVMSTTIMGTYKVGGVVGYNYRRIKEGIDEKISILENSTTDKETKVLGNNSEVGGICGDNNGALVINCQNNADVTGSILVGGVCGQSREYNTGVNGYLIGCGSTEEAIITATSQEGCTGGVVGWTVNNPDHNIKVKTDGVVIACYSLSTVSAPNIDRVGAIIGYSNYSIIRSSWGTKKGTTEICGLFSPTLYASYAFNVNEVNQEKINEMNQVIADYNNNDPSVTGITYEYTCPYTWEIGADGWPVLK